MFYLVGGVYELIGRNILCDSIGQCVNRRGHGRHRLLHFHVALQQLARVKVSAVLVAFFPSLILWSSQALKDGLIILALALAILATLRLMENDHWFRGWFLIWCAL